MWMTSEICGFPGCERPVATVLDGASVSLGYCDLPEHTALSALRATVIGDVSPAATKTLMAQGVAAQAATQARTPRRLPTQATYIPQPSRYTTRSDLTQTNPACARSRASLTWSASGAVCASRNQTSTSAGSTGSGRVKAVVSPRDRPIVVASSLVSASPDCPC